MQIFPNGVTDFKAVCIRICYHMNAPQLFSTLGDLQTTEGFQKYNIEVYITCILHNDMNKNDEY